MSEAQPNDTHPARSRGSLWKNAVGVLLLLASGALITWTLVRASEYPSVNATGPVTEFATPAETAAHLHDVVGTFATGSQPGDRVIVVATDGHLTFRILGPLANTLALSDTFRLSKRGDHVNLVTLHSGIVGQDDIDHLNYCGDTYERTK